MEGGTDVSPFVAMRGGWGGGEAGRGEGAERGREGGRAGEKDRDGRRYFVCVYLCVCVRARTCVHASDRVFCARSTLYASRCNTSCNTSCTIAVKLRHDCSLCIEPLHQRLQRELQRKLQSCNTIFNAAWNRCNRGCHAKIGNE